MEKNYKSNKNKKLTNLFLCQNQIIKLKKKVLNLIEQPCQSFYAHQKVSYAMGVQSKGKSVIKKRSLSSRNNKIMMSKCLNDAIGAKSRQKSERTKKTQKKSCPCNNHLDELSLSIIKTNRSHKSTKSESFKHPFQQNKNKSIQLKKASRLQKSHQISTNHSQKNKQTKRLRTQSTTAQRCSQMTSRSSKGKLVFFQPASPFELMKLNQLKNYKNNIEHSSFSNKRLQRSYKQPFENSRQHQNSLQMIHNKEADSFFHKNNCQQVKSQSKIKRSLKKDQVSDDFRYGEKIKILQSHQCWENNCEVQNIALKEAQDHYKPHQKKQLFQDQKSTYSKSRLSQKDSHVNSPLNSKYYTKPYDSQDAIIESSRKTQNFTNSNSASNQKPNQWDEDDSISYLLSQQYNDQSPIKKHAKMISNSFLSTGMTKIEKKLTPTHVQAENIFTPAQGSAGRKIKFLPQLQLRDLSLEMIKQICRKTQRFVTQQIHPFKQVLTGQQKLFKPNLSQNRQNQSTGFKLWIDEDENSQ